MSRYVATTAGIELDLDLGVERDRLERRGQVLDEQPAGLGDGR